MNINEVVKKVTEEVYKQMGACANAASRRSASAELAGHIEHSILNPDMTREKIITECALAKQYRFANVCVTPYFVREAAQALKTMQRRHLRAGRLSAGRGEHRGEALRNQRVRGKRRDGAGRRAQHRRHQVRRV